MPWLDLLVSLLGAVKMSTLSLMAPALVNPRDHHQHRLLWQPSSTTSSSRISTYFPFILSLSLKCNECSDRRSGQLEHGHPVRVHFPLIEEQFRLRHRIPRLRHRHLHQPPRHHQELPARSSLLVFARQQLQMIAVVGVKMKFDKIHSLYFFCDRSTMFRIQLRYHRHVREMHPLIYFWEFSFLFFVSFL